MRSHRWAIFQRTELGRIYSCIPFVELSNLFPSQSNSSKGAPSWFDNSGKLAIMFLKSYLGLSDAKLVDRLNSDWVLQMFCGRQFLDTERINDRNLPSRIRCFIGQELDIEAFQDVIIEKWQPYIEDTHCGLAVATAYESYIKYPTDIKLIWDCCTWVFESIFVLCKERGIKRPQSKYREQITKQLSFSKRKKKTYKIRQRRRSSLIKLLDKGLMQLTNIIEEYSAQINLKTYVSILAKKATIDTVIKRNHSV